MAVTIKGATTIRGNTTVGFSPASLFAAGEQGVWFDPSDFSTMFQDAAGTTPVTAVEQPVGLIKDKSGRGNNATQSTSGNRPVLSARVNLLTKTEQFDDAYWTANKNTITPNDALAPDGTTTAERFTASASGTGNTQVYRQAITGLPTSILGSACFKKGGTSNGWVALAVGDGTNYYTVSFDVTNGAVGTASTIGSPTNTSSSITSLGGGWYRCSVSMTGNSSNKEMYIIAACTSTSNLAPVVGNYDWVWGADLRPTNQGVGLPAYQRVNTSTDYDTVGFPMYLKFDGSASSMATGSINFTSTDKMTVLTGVRKLTDAITGAIVELGAPGTSTGNFWLDYGQAGAGYPSSSNYDFQLRGTTYAGRGATTFAAPITNVVSASFDIGASGVANEVTGNVNGSVPTFTTQSGRTDAGTGNFGNLPLYFGSRTGASLYLNGNLYSLIVRGAASTSAQISATEAYVNQKTRAY